MARWHFSEPRGQGREVWNRESRAQRIAALARALGAAEEAGAALRGTAPAPGWVSDAHSKDGKLWVCNRGTQGARPAWIWTGDTRTQ